MDRAILTLLADGNAPTRLVAVVGLLDHTAVIIGTTEKRSELLLLADDCLDLCGYLWTGSALAAAEMSVEIADAAAAWGFTVTVDGTSLSPEGAEHV